MVTGVIEQSKMLPDDTTYPSVVPLMVDSLLPATNYILRTLAVYPNDESNYSDSINFTTSGMHLHVHVLYSSCYSSDGVPGIPEISLVGSLLQWSKPRENGQPITRFRLRLEPRYWLYSNHNSP